MSYMTIIPNLYGSLSPNQQYLYYNQQQAQKYSNQTYQILFSLSQALKTSVQNYQTNMYKSQPTVSSMQDQANNQLSFSDKSPKLSKSIISKEEIKEFTKNTGCESLVKNSHQTINLNDKIITNNQQPLTDDQLYVEQKKYSQKISNNGLKKRTKKNRQNGRGEQFIVVVPQVDRIQTAYLPEFKIDYEELNRKKQNLLNRQITSWDSISRSKRDKRQIRNLGN